MLERALVSVSDALVTIGGQLVVVRDEASDGGRERVQRLAHQYRCSLVFAEPGCGRAGMSREGMRLATGDIVVVRQDAAIGDASWLGVFEAMCGRPVERETAVADLSLDLEVIDERAIVGGWPSGRFPHSTRRRGDASSDPVA